MRLLHMVTARTNFMTAAPCLRSTSRNAEILVFSLVARA
jgi:hypothetical protein